MDLEKEIKRLGSSMLMLFIISVLGLILFYANSLIANPLVVFPRAILLIIGITLAVIEIFALIKAKDAFSRINNVISVDLGIAGANLSLIGSFLLLFAIAFILSSVLLLSLFLLGFNLYLMGLGALAVGYILLGVGVYKIGKAFSDTLTKAGGILISVIVLSLIGFILSYFGLKEVKPEIIIQGEGIVENGITRIFIYSNVKGYLESISSAGKTIFDFKPKKIKEGETVIEVNEELQDPVIIVVNIGEEKIERILNVKK